MTQKLQNQRGRLFIADRTFIDLKDEELKALFSNFYPTNIERRYDHMNSPGIIMYGCSPLFNALDEASIIPYYAVHMIWDPKPNTYTVKMEMLTGEHSQDEIKTHWIYERKDNRRLEYLSLFLSGILFGILLLMLKNML